MEKIITDFIFQISGSEAKQIRAQATQRGYSSVDAYIRTLIVADEIVQSLAYDWQDTEEDASVLDLNFVNHGMML